MNFDACARFDDGAYRDYSDDIRLVLDAARKADHTALGLGRGTGRALLTLGDDGFHVIEGDENAARLTRQTPLLALFAPCRP